MGVDRLIFPKACTTALVAICVVLLCHAVIVPTQALVTCDSGFVAGTTSYCVSGSSACCNSAYNQYVLARNVICGIYPYTSYPIACCCGTAALTPPAPGHLDATTSTALSGGAIAGIVIGVIIGVALMVAAVVFIIWVCKRRGHAPPGDTHVPEIPLEYPPKDSPGKGPSTGHPGVIEIVGNSDQHDILNISPVGYGERAEPK